MQLIEENPYYDIRNSQGELGIQMNNKKHVEKKHKRIFGGDLLKRSASRIPSIQSGQGSKISG